MMLVFEVNDFCIGFCLDVGVIVVVKGVSFVVGKGEIVVLVGEFGLGKLVMVLLMVGLLGDVVEL